MITKFFSNKSSITIVFIVLFIQYSNAQDPCLSQVALDCGISSSYSINGSGVWNPVGPWGTPGAEQVFTYVPPVSGDYDITVTNNNYYVDLFFATSCGPNVWTYLSDIYLNEVNTLNLTAGVTYYFLIDDENTTISSGSVTISCPCIPPLNGIDQASVISSTTFNYVNTTIGACNDCSLRASNDRVLEFEIVCAGDYILTLCNGATWDTYLFLSDQPCGGNVLAFNDDDCGLQSTITATLDTGVYYLNVEGYSISSQGEFDLEITTTCDFGPLPVELLYFKGTNENRLNYLTWHTVSEINNDYFIVERSIGGQDFIKIGEIKGHGTTEIPNDYLFIDDNFEGSVNYYRLKQIDFDGTEAIHNTIAVSSNYQGPIRVFPNPAKNRITVSSEDHFDDPVISLQNSLGRFVDTQISISTNDIIIDVDVLPGVYLLTINIDNTIETKRVVIQ